MIHVTKVQEWLHQKPTRNQEFTNLFNGKWIAFDIDSTLTKKEIFEYKIKGTLIPGNYYIATNQI